MPAIKENNSGWEYTGRNSKGKPKFRRPTNQTLDYVKSYLDELDVVYLVREAATLIFIYKDKDPVSMYSPRYAYYYSTGRWGSDRRNKHYHSKGIEDFMENYYTTSEEARARWADKSKGED